MTSMWKQVRRPWVRTSGPSYRRHAFAHQACVSVVAGASRRAIPSPCRRGRRAVVSVWGYCGRRAGPPSRRALERPTWCLEFERTWGVFASLSVQRKFDHARLHVAPPLERSRLAPESRNSAPRACGAGVDTYCSMASVPHSFKGEAVGRSCETGVALCLFDKCHARAPPCKQVPTLFDDCRAP